MKNWNGKVFNWKKFLRVKFTLNSNTFSGFCLRSWSTFILWNIWLYRNKLIFSKIFSNYDFTWFSIKRNINELNSYLQSSTPATNSCFSPFDLSKDTCFTIICDVSFDCKTFINSIAINCFDFKGFWCDSITKMSKIRDTNMAKLCAI